MAEEQHQEDLDKLNSYIKDRFTEYFSEAIQPYQQAHVPQAAPAMTQEQQYQQQLRDVIAPVISPDINAARFDAADANDRSDFYIGHPEHLEYRERVETLFKEAQRNGRAMPRDAIYNYIIGKEYRADPRKFTEAQRVKHEQDIARAEGAIDFGGNTIPREKAEPLQEKLRNFDKLPVAEMEEVLDSLGMTF